MITIGHDSGGADCRMARAVAMPSMPGIFQSSTTTSGSRPCKRSSTVDNAASPESTASTCHPRPCAVATTAPRAMLLSSATKALS
jgi:hypothetical protein